MMAATQKVRLRTLVGHGDEDEERDNEDVKDESEGEGEEGKMMSKLPNKVVTYRVLILF